MDDVFVKFQFYIPLQSLSIVDGLIKLLIVMRNCDFGGGLVINLCRVRAV